MPTDPSQLTHERAREICMLARTQGTWTENFASGAKLRILWSDALCRAFLHFISGGGDVSDYQIDNGEGVEIRLWQAIRERADWLSKPVERHVGETS